MTGKARPPFRADHVGSLLRPPEVLRARDQTAKGEITAERLAQLLPEKQKSEQLVVILAGALAQTRVSESIPSPEADQTQQHGASTGRLWGRPNRRNHRDEKATAG